MMKEVFDESQLTNPNYYYNNDKIENKSLILMIGQDVKKLLNIKITDYNDYSERYIFKKIN